MCVRVYICIMYAYTCSSHRYNASLRASNDQMYHAKPNTLQHSKQKADAQRFNAAFSFAFQFSYFLYTSTPTSRHSFQSCTYQRE